MPENEDFLVQIIVGDLPVPEYEKDGEYFVECNLTTPYSYRVKQASQVSGEVESQEWPVTPYKVKLTAKCDMPRRYFDVFVDGVKVKSCCIAGGQSRLISGFKDKASVREFLFSLPRYAVDEEDRLVTGRENKVGVIEVESYDAMFIGNKYKQRKGLQFQQANKEDCGRVTKGLFTMSTTKIGGVLYNKSKTRLVHVWRRLSFLSKLTVQYRMGHTLAEMGFTLKPYPEPITMDLSFSSDDSQEPTPSTSQQGPALHHKRRRRQRIPQKRKFTNTKDDPIVIDDDEGWDEEDDHFSSSDHLVDDEAGVTNNDDVIVTNVVPKSEKTRGISMEVDLTQDDEVVDPAGGDIKTEGVGVFVPADKLATDSTITDIGAGDRNVGRFDEVVNDDKPEGSPLLKDKGPSEPAELHTANDNRPEVEEPQTEKTAEETDPSASEGDKDLRDVSSVLSDKSEKIVKIEPGISNSLEQRGMDVGGVQTKTVSAVDNSETESSMDLEGGQTETITAAHGSQTEPSVDLEGGQLDKWQTETSLSLSGSQAETHLHLEGGESETPSAVHGSEAEPSSGLEADQTETASAASDSQAEPSLDIEGGQN